MWGGPRVARPGRLPAEQQVRAARSGPAVCRGLSYQCRLAGPRRWWWRRPGQRGWRNLCPSPRNQPYLLFSPLPPLFAAARRRRARLVPLNFRASDQQDESATHSSAQQQQNHQHQHPHLGRHPLTVRYGIPCQAGTHTGPGALHTPPTRVLLSSHVTPHTAGGPLGRRDIRRDGDAGGADDADDAWAAQQQQHLSAPPAPWGTRLRRQQPAAAGSAGGAAATEQ